MIDLIYLPFACLETMRKKASYVSVLLGEIHLLTFLAEMADPVG